MSAKKQNPIASTESTERSTTIIPSGLSKQQSTEESLGKLNRTYALLSAVNHTIVRVREPQALFDANLRAS